MEEGKQEEELSVDCLASQQQAGVYQGRIRPVGLLVGCLTSQRHASVSQGRDLPGQEIEVADQFCYLTVTVY